MSELAPAGELALALDAGEARRLAELEAVVEAGLQTFVDVGRALLEIRDGRLYRQTHGTFEAYLDERWNISRRHGYRLIDAARVAELVSPIGHTPANEAQARELVPLLQDEQALVETWRELLETYGDELTAIRARVIVKRVLSHRIERIRRERRASEAHEAERAWVQKRFELRADTRPVGDPERVAELQWWLRAAEVALEDAMDEARFCWEELSDYEMRHREPACELVDEALARLYAEELEEIDRRFGVRIETQAS